MNQVVWKIMTQESVGSLNARATQQQILPQFLEGSATRPYEIGIGEWARVYYRVLLAKGIGEDIV